VLPLECVPVRQCRPITCCAVLYCAVLCCVWTASMGYGGAVFCEGNSHVEVHQSFFEGNEATFGGGLLMHENATGGHGRQCQQAQRPEGAMHLCTASHCPHAPKRTSPPHVPPMYQARPPTSQAPIALVSACSLTNKRQSVICTVACRRSLSKQLHCEPCQGIRSWHLRQRLCEAQFDRHHAHS
jgi:hypothetical protein